MIRAINIHKRTITVGYRVLLVAAGTLLLSGCAYYGAARIISIPRGAEVVNLEDDTVLGRTPVDVWWKDNSSKPKFINVRFQKSGYRSKVTAFWVNLRHNTRKSALDDPQLVKIELKRKGSIR